MPEDQLLGAPIYPYAGYWGSISANTGMPVPSGPPPSYTPPWEHWGGTDGPPRERPSSDPVADFYGAPQTNPYALLGDPLEYYPPSGFDLLGLNGDLSSQPSYYPTAGDDPNGSGQMFLPVSPAFGDPSAQSTVTPTGGGNNDMTAPDETPTDFSASTLGTFNTFGSDFPEFLGVFG
jgi:hypothetical protein